MYGYTDEVVSPYVWFIIWGKAIILFFTSTRWTWTTCNMVINLDADWDIDLILVHIPWTNFV